MTRALLGVALGVALAASLVACGADEEPAAEGDTRARVMVMTGATLLDVRTPREFAAGHLEGAVNIPITELADRRAEVPTDHDVVVYCQSGGRSAAAARDLTAHGYEVYDLGAMSSW